MKESTLEAPLQTLLSDFLVPLAAEGGATAAIRAATDENARAADVAAALSGETYYRRYILAQSFLTERVSDWKSEMPDSEQRSRVLLERTAGLLGKTGLRNLVACARLDRFSGSPAKWEAEEEPKLNVTPSRVLPCAFEAEKFCQDGGWLAPEWAFAAGLHYDWLGAIAKARQGGTPADKSAVGAAFKEGMAVAKLAYRIGTRARRVKLGKHLFAAGLLMPVGKAILSWRSELEQAAKQSGERAFDYYTFVEKRRFPVTQAEASSLVASFAGLIPGLELGLCFQLEPYRLRTHEADLYELASVLSLAARVARFGTDKIPLEPFQVQWMSDNGIGMDVFKKLG